LGALERLLSYGLGGHNPRCSPRVALDSDRVSGIGSTWVVVSYTVEVKVGSAGLERSLFFLRYTTTPTATAPSRTTPPTAPPMMAPIDELEPAEEPAHVAVPEYTPLFPQAPVGQVLLAIFLPYPFGPYPG